MPKGTADAAAPAGSRQPQEGWEQIVRGRRQWAQALHDAGRHEEARAALAEVFKLAPSDAEARQLAAQLEGLASDPARPAEPDAAAEQDRRAVLALLARYKAALEQEDLAALKSIWPGLDEDSVRERLQFVRSWSLTLQLVDLQVTGDLASALCETSDELLTVDGEQVQNKSRVHFALRREAGSWVIEGMQ